MLRALAAGLVLVSIPGSLRADVIYDNSVNDLVTRFNPENAVVGDEVTFAGSSRLLTDFSFEYYGLSFSGDEFVTVKFYDTTGAPFNGFGSPGNLLFDSGPVAIPATPRATLNFDRDTLGPDLVVPDTLIWTVEFTGIDLGAGENAGLDLYSPPVVGSSFDDYWQLNGTSWELLANTGGTPVNFASRFEATVPEPSSFAYLLVGGVLGAFVMFRRRLG